MGMAFDGVAFDGSGLMRNELLYSNQIRIIKKSKITYYFNPSPPSNK